MMPDGSWILTKVLRTPVVSWRERKIPVFIHVDDGLGLSKTKEGAVAEVKIVQDDLERLGLITSATVLK